MMSFMNFRTAILCCAYCLCACCMSVNAQKITIDLSTATGATGAQFATPFFQSPERFTGTQNGVTTSNVLTAPITVAVLEAGSTGLELTLVNATATTGVDDVDGENRTNISMSGLGIALRGTNRRVDPAVPAFTFEDASVRQGILRLDLNHEEFLTFAFSLDVTVSAVVLNGLDPEERFQFGSATDITDLSNMTLADLTPGAIEELPPNLQVFTFETPMEIAAGEEIVVGQTGFNPALGGGNVGVGFEQIILTVDEGTALLGDVNLDGVVDFLDISLFITVLATGGFQEEADIDGNGAVDFLDISGFILILSGT